MPEATPFTQRDGFMQYTCLCGTHWSGGIPLDGRVICRRCERHYEIRDTRLIQVSSRRYRQLADEEGGDAP